MQAAAQDIYNAQQQAGGAQGAGFNPNAGAANNGNANNQNGNNVQDADFEEVK